jgi:hypothetical protein
MTETQALIDSLRIDIAIIFHRYLFVNNKQTSSYKLSSNQNSALTNPVKQARINLNKYDYLFNRTLSQR